MRLSPFPDKQTLLNIYSQDDYFDNYYATADGIKGYTDAGIDIYRNDSLVLKRIREYKTRGRLLDIGCEGGHFLANAKKLSFETYGVEINKKMVDHARHANQLKVFEGDLAGADFEEGYFDIIYAQDVLEHMLDLNKNIEIIKKILNKDGIFVINQHLTYNKSLNNLFLAANMFFKKDRFSKYPPTHLWEFNAKTLKDYLIKSGFQILRYSLMESKAKPFNAKEGVDFKRLCGYCIKNLSSIVSNLKLLKRFNLGDRALVVCRKGR